MPLRSRLLIPLIIFLALAVGAPTASADCGKTVIDQYFSTGIIKYHQQKCYDSALKQIDPDARMYSGIMAAIRAARARDRARDNRPAREAVEDGAAVVPESGAEPVAPIDEPVEEIVPELEELPAAELPRELDESARAALEPDPVTTAAIAEIAPEIDEPAVTPLAVLMVGGIASLVTLAGLVGVAARRLTGRP